MVVATRSTEHGRTAKRNLSRQPFGAPNVFALAVIEGSEPNAVHRIVQEETVIGRGDEAHVEIEDTEVSKRHCLIRVEGSVCTVLDLESLNGTRVNGRRMRGGVAQRVRHLDEICVGSTRVLVLAGRFIQRKREEE